MMITNNMIVLVTLLLCVALVMTTPTHETPSPPSNLGSDKDEYGCIKSAGYRWCEDLAQCLHVTETCEPPSNGDSSGQDDNDVNNETSSNAVEEEGASEVADEEEAANDYALHHDKEDSHSTSDPQPHDTSMIHQAEVAQESPSHHDTNEVPTTQPHRFTNIALSAIRSLFSNNHEGSDLGNVDDKDEVREVPR